MKTQIQVYRTIIAMLPFVTALAAPVDAAAQPNCVSSPPGLVSWWPAEGNPDDIAPGANPGILQNGASFATGKVGSAFNFDGVANYISVAASSSLNVGVGTGLTIECWLRTDNLSRQQTIAEWNDGSGHVGSQLHISIPGYGGLGSIFANLLDSGGNDHFIATAPNILTLGTFQQVAVTYDKSSGAAHLYLNGIVVATANMGGFTPQTTYPLFFGKRVSGPGTGSYFQGLMDEMSLYNRGLLESEILAIYNAGVAGKCGSSDTNPPNIVVQPEDRTVAVGDNVTFSVFVSGFSLKYQWHYNDLDLSAATNATLVLPNIQTNQAGIYSVTVSNLNGSVTSSNATLIAVVPGTRYVDASNPTPSLPYTSWSTAATNIQDAVDVASAGDEVIVTNGTYASGGRAVYGTMTNRVAVDRPLYVHSVNGPQFTFINGRQLPSLITGDGAIRCAYLTNGASLSGFTLANGATLTGGSSGASLTNEMSGGGLFCASTDAQVSNCVFTANAATYYGGGVFSGTLTRCLLLGNNCTYGSSEGGGAAYSTLTCCSLVSNTAFNGGGSSGGWLSNCVLLGNFAPTNGGGAYGGTLNNCTLVGNSNARGRPLPGPGVGGGASFAVLNNCILYYNTSGVASNYFGGTMNFCCTAPQPSEGSGNITSEPLLVDLAGGNLRLQSNSPCINAGNNSYAGSAADLDGRPRIVGGQVDMGAYEFQPGVSGAFLGWLQQYGLPTDGSADYADSDGDGMNNWQEWRCQTNPTNALSVLRMISADRSGDDVSVTWQSVAAVNYFLERSTNLMAVPAFVPLVGNLPGQAGTTSYLDLNAAGANALFYRVGVGN